LRQPIARIFRQGARDLIPVGKSSPQQQVWFDGFLYLVKGKAEFTPPTG
jgi:hypothetical protein